MLPESPRWLLSKNKKEEAFEILNKVAKTNKRELNQESWNNLLDEERASVNNEIISLIKK